MADDKSKTDNRDRSQISARQDYEARYFAQEAGISLEQATQLIERHGHDRETLLAEAGKMLKRAS